VVAIFVVVVVDDAEVEVVVVDDAEEVVVAVDYI